MTDYDDFDYDGLDDLTGPSFDSSFDAGFDLDDTPATRSATPTARATAGLVAGETGVAFDALVLFAEPLFQLYGLDIADAFALKAEADAADPEVLAVIEAARLLWAFFSLPPSDRAHRRNALAAHLVGPNPTEEDWLDIEGLLDTVEPYWQAMLPEEIQRAQRTGHPVLDFDALQAHPTFRLDAASTVHSYGPDALSEIEARALFAQPLLDDPSTLADPDAFEHAMDRVNAYWVLAQLDAAEREPALRKTAVRLASGSGNRQAVEKEARSMLDRFFGLFPEHARAA